MRIRLLTVAVFGALLASTLTGLTLAPTASAFVPTLTYVDCPVDAGPAGVQCAKLTVPLDWQRPDDGRTTDIAVRIVRAPRSGGGFTFNPGGPGSSGIDAGPGIYALLPEAVRERFDFVMWDPRGVGLSGPVVAGCEPSPRPDLPETGPVDWSMDWMAYAEARRAANRACFEANPDSAPYLGTWQVVRDLEAMRAALGYSKWNYWGMSYGTRIGYTLAQTFPERIRTMVVDGSLWPQESVDRIASQQPAAWFAGQQVYASLTGKAQGRKISQVIAALDDTVVTLDGVPYSRWTAAAIVYGSLGSQALYPDVRILVNGLYDLLFSRPSPSSSRAPRSPSAIADAARRLARGAAAYSQADYVNAFIHCADLHDRPTPARAVQLAESAANNYGTALGFATGFSLTCMGLPADYAPAVPRGLATIALTTAPMVVLSTGDVRTPWIWGRTMANQYAGSRTISYASSQHVTYLRTPSTCVNAPVTRYILRRTLPGGDLSCPFAPSD